MLRHHERIFSLISEFSFFVIFRSSLNIGSVIMEIAINDKDFPLTFFPLQFPPALLVDEAGSHRTEQHGCCQETDGGHDASHHRPCQSSFLHHLWRREEVCGGEEGS